MERLTSSYCGSTVLPVSLLLPTVRILRAAVNAKINGAKQKLATETNVKQEVLGRTNRLRSLIRHGLHRK
jgi:hypothetical protein